MDREWNCYPPSKVNGKCVYEGKCRSKCLIYEVKCSLCDAIYIGNTQQTIKKEWAETSLISYVYSRTKKKPDSFAAHLKQHFNTTMSYTDLRKYTTFKVLKQLNPIGEDYLETRT